MVGEEPRAKLSGMNKAGSRPRQPTQQLREASRLTRVAAINLGQNVKRARRALRLRQRDLGDRLGVTQAWISRIELGHGQGVPLERWIALGVALERPLAISFSRPLGQVREPTDAGHLAMQERLLQLARATGRTASFELPTRATDPRDSIDVCVRDPRHRVLIIQEAWNTFGDIGAAVRSTNRKGAEAADLAATIDDGPPYRVATVWIVRPTAANRALLARYPGIFGSAFPGSSRAWARALATGSTPPGQPGLVWLDPTSGRLTEWRRSG
jgi:transcriptional regulator with XRE-family HTH domain